MIIINVKKSTIKVGKSTFLPGKEYPTTWDNIFINDFINAGLVVLPENYLDMRSCNKAGYYPKYYNDWKVWYEAKLNKDMKSEDRNQDKVEAERALQTERELTLEDKKSKELEDAKSESSVIEDLELQEKLKAKYISRIEAENSRMEGKSVETEVQSEQVNEVENLTNEDFNIQEETPIPENSELGSEDFDFSSSEESDEDRLARLIYSSGR